MAENDKEMTALCFALDAGNRERMQLLERWAMNMRRSPKDMENGEIPEFLFTDSVSPHVIGTLWKATKVQSFSG